MDGFRIFAVSLCLLFLGCCVQGVEIGKYEFEELYDSVQESRQNLEEVAKQLQQLVENAQRVVQDKEYTTDTVDEENMPSADKDEESSADKEEESSADEKKVFTADKEEGSLCAKVLTINPKAPSGSYVSKGVDGEKVKIHCNMEKKCGRHGSRGWIRLGYLNMSVATHHCPNEFKEVSDPVRGCRRASTETSCASMTFPNPGKLPYTTVCGSFVAAQHGSPDALIKKGDKDGWEYDGISVHLHQSGTYLVVLGAPGEEINKWFTCPCKALDDPEQETLLTFGTDLNPSKFCPFSKEGACPAKINCCSGEGLPPFCVTLPEPTTDDITVKLCLDDDGEEDITIQQVELLVQ